MPARQLSILLILVVALPITALGENPPPDTSAAAAAARTNQKLDSIVALNTRLVNSELSEAEQNPARDIAMAGALALVGLALIVAWYKVRKLEIDDLENAASREPPSKLLQTLLEVREDKSKKAEDALNSFVEKLAAATKDIKVATTTAEKRLSEVNTELTSLSRELADMKRASNKQGHNETR